MCRGDSRTSTAGCGSRRKPYFVNSLTQRQVADIVGLSQMHASRLLDRSCTFLRRGLLGS